MMKKYLDFNRLFKPLLIACGVIAALGILFLIIFSGKAEAQYTLSNLRFSLILKMFVTAVFAFGLTTAYFSLRVRNKGLWFSLFTGLSAVINSLVSFFFCVICWAPLGELTFAVMIFAIFLSYLTAVLFVSNLTLVSAKKKKKSDSRSDFETLAKNAFTTVLPLLFAVTLILVVSFVICLVFSVGTLALYALPAIISGVFTVVFTLSFGCKLYFKKMK